MGMEDAFELYPKWLEIPDGTREPLQYPYFFNYNGGEMYYGMTAPHGWERFNGVRNEERFKAAIDRVKKLMEIKQS